MQSIHCPSSIEAASATAENRDDAKLRRRPRSAQSARLCHAPAIRSSSGVPDSARPVREGAADRIGCRIDGREVQLLSRRGNDWTADFPEVVAAAKKLKTEVALLDGEVAAALPDGRTWS
jgi:hypothetical protein